MSDKTQIFRPGVTELDATQPAAEGRTGIDSIERIAGEPCGPEVTSVGKYDLVRVLGEGSMGTVYKAVDRFSESVVAIKLANPGLIDGSAGGRRMRKLFYNEAHAAGLLDHPNILKIFDAGFEGESYYLVMEYIAGGRTLADHVKPRTLLPIRDAVRIVYKLANALDYAHERGVVHRDIKPSNILLSEEGEVKLADLSIALITARDAGETQVSGVMGTPLYMAPEQGFEEAVTRVTDIFALGVVFYQLLTGRHPFAADSVEKIIWNIENLEPEPPSKLRQGCPEALDYIVRRMLSKRPGRRYGRGVEVSAELGLLFENLDGVEDQDDLEQKLEELKRSEFFHEFSVAELWELLRAGQWKSYRAGEEVMREGDPSSSVHFVLSGHVSVLKGGRVVVESLGPGECLGELGFLGQTTRSATVIAKTDAATMELNESVLRSADGGCQVRFLNAFVRVLSRRLLEMTEASVQGP